ncbi:hypothetical protein QBA54_50830 [Streptomyces sp. B21-108]
MNGWQKVAVILAAGSLVTSAALPGRQTANIIGKFFDGFSKWTKTTQGRG